MSNDQNKLASDPSPYLQQHKNNPVNWQTWSEDVLENAKNGYFIENANDLAEKIILLLNNPEKVENMGIQSLKMVQKFSWNNVVKNIIEESSKKT